MEKEKIEFEQFLSAVMALYSTKISYDVLLRFMGMFFSNHQISDKYEYIETPINCLEKIIDRKGISFELKNGLELNTNISEIINWKKPCTVEEYLIIVSGKSLFNDVYLMVQKAKGESTKIDDLSKDQYTKKLYNFYGE